MKSQSAPMTNLQEITKLENELKLKSMLGREYFSDESQAMKLKLQNLKAELILQ